MVVSISGASGSNAAFTRLFMKIRKFNKCCTEIHSLGLEALHVPCLILKLKGVACLLAPNALIRFTMLLEIKSPPHNF